MTAKTASNTANGLERIKDPLRPGKVAGQGDGPQPEPLRTSAKPSRTNTPLNTMQRRFADNYIQTGVIGESAIRAGYSTAAMGTQLLKNQKVQRYIAQRRQRMQAKVDEMFDINAKAILRELALIAFSNMGSYFKDWGQRQQTIRVPDKRTETGFREITINENYVIPKNKAELTEMQQKCISEIALEENARGKTFRFKTQSKTKALELLGQYFGLFDGMGSKADPLSQVQQLRSAAAQAEEMFPGGSVMKMDPEAPTDGTDDPTTD